MFQINITRKQADKLTNKTFLHIHSGDADVEVMDFLP